MNRFAIFSKLLPKHSLRNPLNTLRFVNTKPPITPTLVKKIQPYISLTRFKSPTGTALLYIPCTWPLLLNPSPSLLLVFLIGSIILRSAGCTINDIWDYRVDRLVERTRLRPIACGDVSVKNAVRFLGIQLGLGLGVLMCLDWVTVWCGVGAVVLVGLYPLMKRYTYNTHMTIQVIARGDDSYPNNYTKIKPI
jgi:4-hydroxybenzoate polyprenyltransferase